MIRFLLFAFSMSIFGQEADILRKHVTYLASDELKGRPLPSPGLDSAANYIAGQFQKIGLATAGDDGYFQNFERVLMRPDWSGYEFTIRNGKEAIKILRTELLPFSPRALRFDDAELIKVDPDNGPWLKSLRKEDIEGKILAIRIIAQAESEEKQENFQAAMGLVMKFSPALILMYGPTAAAAEVPGVMLEPNQQPPAGVLRFPVRTDLFRELVEPMPGGRTKLRVTLHLKPAVFDKLKVHNVAGIVRGSDAALRDNYDLVTANYDGFPMRRIGEDGISNSANANASGVAALIELARVLSAAKPKRSILFLATAGESPDGPGPKYYREHPLVPIVNTNACFNLLQLGRTDTLDGPKIASAAITGFSRTKLPALFRAAGKESGVDFYEDRRRDAENGRGFQPLLSESKVPSHAIYVAFGFADLRRVSDEAGKLDYDNLAKITKAIAAGLTATANENNP